MANEDLLIKLEQSDCQFAHGSWDENKHPRTGTAPNPGWFAPKDRSSAGSKPSEAAADEREERRPEEAFDPLAELRQAQWEAGIATLRRIDPNKPQLTYFANPRAAPKPGGARSPQCRNQNGRHQKGHREVDARRCADRQRRCGSEGARAARRRTSGLSYQATPGT